MAAIEYQPLPARSPSGWFKLMGPGAIVASMTIGTGELIFSSRGGAIFGYNVLFLFVFISILKWGLVLASSRHIILSGVHPYMRMASLPGPRGWFLILFSILCGMTMPVWVCFHSTVLGNLTAWVSNTEGALNGAIDYVWGACFLTAIIVLTATGGYTTLERVQIFVVGAMIVCAGVTLFIYNPDWLAMLKGAVIPQPLEYPEWLTNSAHPNYSAEYNDRIARHSEWVEATRYVGVIGGAAIDYMAYVSWLREKRWGRAGSAPASNAELQEMAADPRHPARQWLVAPMVDVTVSFVLIVAFSTVFVAAGALVLGPEGKIPTEASLLSLQADFVTQAYPDWSGLLLLLYISGAFLTMIGTLYGTIEIFHTFVREGARVLRVPNVEAKERLFKWISVAWCSTIGYALLAWVFYNQYNLGGEAGLESKRLVLTILTPVNLFTGVLACGLICLVSLWIDFRFLPKGLRMPKWLAVLNVFSAIVLSALGLKGYWDSESRYVAIFVMGGILLFSLLLSSIIRLPSDPEDEDDTGWKERAKPEIMS